MSEHGNTITVFSEPDEMIESGHGFIDYAEWCDLECGRIRDKGVDCRVVSNDKGEIAISRQER